MPKNDSEFQKPGLHWLIKIFVDMGVLRPQDTKHKHTEQFSVYNACSIKSMNCYRMLYSFVYHILAIISFP